MLVRSSDGGRMPHLPRLRSIRYPVAKNRKSMPYCCKDYREYLSVRKGMVMESSKLDFRQSSLWHMLQRIRELYDLAMPKLTGTERNRHDPKQTGSLLMQGKVTVMDAKQRNDDHRLSDQPGTRIDVFWISCRIT